MRLNLTFILICLFSISGWTQITRNGCTSSQVRIVILGSSTAAGSGATTDSAWVNRYRAGLQQINPNNEVINLAVGGFTTYRIMPDNFVPPANRPAVDTLHNITQALSLSPDAIIVNLPSNDRQWPAVEQLANFDSLYRHSWNNGVPMYICTTQPITSSGTYQRTVRDSILSMFGPHAIDVFTPLADTNNTIQSQFAADAVHLNNKGHNVLFNSVWNKDILVDITAPIAGIPVDFEIIDAFPTPGTQCIGQLQQGQIQVVVANKGSNNTQLNRIKVIVNQIDTVQSSVYFLNSCQIDTIPVNFNVPLAQTPLHIIADHQLDTSKGDNYYDMNFRAYNPPDSVHWTPPGMSCLGDTIYLPQNNAVGDTVVWNEFYFAYSTPVKSEYVVLNQQALVLFARPILSPHTLQSTLRTTSTPNVTWDGNMFNVIADSNLTLTEIRFVTGSSGTSYPLLHMCNGSYVGNENNPSAWTLLAADTVNGLAVDDSITLRFNKRLQAGDTLGLYVHFGSSAHRLRYQSGSSGTTYSTPELTFKSGAGISHNFGAVYPNRTISAEIEYSYGFDSIGRCSSTLQFFGLYADTALPNLPDTVYVNYPGSTIGIDSSFTQISWTNLSTQQVIGSAPTLFIDTAQFGSNTTIPIAVEALSVNGCIHYDTTYAVWAPFHLNEIESGLSIYPNPTTGVLYIDGLNLNADYSVFDLSGNQIQYGEVSVENGRIEILNRASGVYILELRHDDSTEHFRFILTN